MRVPRLYFESALKLGSVIKLDGDSTHYLSKVLRLKSTNQIKLFNGSEGEFLGSITAKSNDSMTVSIDSHVRKPVDDKIKFHLALAITKGERMDYAIQKSVELGVFTITPFFSTLSEVVIKDKKRAMNKLRHWRKVALNASQQCERLSVPGIEEPTTFEDFIARDSKRVCILLDSSGSKKLKEVSFERDLFLMVGPEGGFSSSELVTARSKMIIATMGPRILRAETAPVTALSILQAEFGDLS